MMLIAAGVAALLYFEQIALIYVLATLFLVILLLIVAFADLEKVGRIEEDEENAANSRAFSESEVQKEAARNYVKSGQPQSFG